MRIFLFVFLFATSVFAAADSTHSPDGHAHPFAWFLRTKENRTDEIRYCVKAKTAAERKEIAGLVSWSFSSWDAFYIMLIASSQDIPNGYVPYELKMRTSPELNNECQGNEDLTIYYGVEDQRTQTAKKLYESPLGFAHLESYDENTGASRGFIWISDAPEVRMHKNHRTALIAHEIGHVIGLGHVEGTIMEAGIADTIAKAYRSGVPFDPKSRRDDPHTFASARWVDFEQNLAGWTETSFSYFGWKVNIAQGSQLEKAALALTGETLNGDFEIGFQRLVSWPDETTKEWEPKGKGRFALCSKKCAKDSAYYREFKVEYGNPFWLPLGEEKLFRCLYKGKEQFIPRRSLITPGVFVDIKTGRRTEFLMTGSGADGLDLDLLLNGEKIRL